MNGRSAASIACWLTMIALVHPVAADLGGTGTGETPVASTQFSQAEFRQTRHVPALDRPLISSGSIQITPGGFIWVQRAPFENRLVFDGETVTETTRIGDDDIVRPLQDPITTNITRTLYGMMTGSWDAIERSFRISAQPADPGSWRRLLIPNDPKLAERLPGISLSGAEFLQHIEVQQPDGALTLIELSAHETLSQEKPPAP